MPVAVMTFAGLEPKAALPLPRETYRGGEISTSGSKAGEPVFSPVPQPLAMIIATATKHTSPTLCVASSKQPWTLSGIRASWRPVRTPSEKAGRLKPSLTFHGLRHKLAVIIRAAGHDERTIADAFGRRTIEMARHDARGADLARNMRALITPLRAEFAERLPEKTQRQPGRPGLPET